MYNQTVIITIIINKEIIYHVNKQTDCVDEVNLCMKLLNKSFNRLYWLDV